MKLGTVLQPCSVGEARPLAGLAHHLAAYEHGIQDDFIETRSVVVPIRFRRIERGDLVDNAER